MRRFDPIQLIALVLLGTLAFWGVRVAAKQPPPVSSGFVSGGRHFKIVEQHGIAIEGEVQDIVDLGWADWEFADGHFTMVSEDGSITEIWPRDISASMSTEHSGLGVATHVYTFHDTGRRLGFQLRQDDYDHFLKAIMWGVPSRVTRGEAAGGEGSRSNFWWVDDGHLVLMQDGNRSQVPLDMLVACAFRPDRTAVMLLTESDTLGPFYTMEPAAIARGIAESGRFEITEPASWITEWRVSFQ